MDVLSLLRPKKKTAPAKRWRNWYRALIDHERDGRPVFKGDVIPGAMLWPTRDIAETMAERSREWNEAWAEDTGEPIPVKWIEAREAEDA